MQTPEKEVPVLMGDYQENPAVLTSGLLTFQSHTAEVQYLDITLLHSEFPV